MAEYMLNSPSEAFAVCERIVIHGSIRLISPKDLYVRPISKPIAPVEEQRLDNIRELIGNTRSIRALRSRLPTRERSTKRCRARIAREAVNNKKTGDTSERYRIELENEAQRLQRIKRGLETCQQHVQITREAAAMKKIGEALEKYYVKQQEKADLEREAVKTRDEQTRKGDF
ncbi:hypothetical protein BGZ81_006437 [Podila clonocystis]|nr:hypothetical protein BGZ81_006437 [Podila clonocystis]